MKSDKGAGVELKASGQAAMGSDAGKKTGAAAVQELNRQHPNQASLKRPVAQQHINDSGRANRAKGTPMAKGPRA